MKGIILAAGRGSRLKQLTDDKPKCCIQIGGRPLLQWQLTALQSSGIKEIFVVTGYRAEMIEPYQVQKIRNPDWDKGNMVKSFLCAKKEFNDSCIITYSDIIYDSHNVSDLIKQPQERDIVIAYDKNWRKLWEMRFENPSSDAESFKIDSNDMIYEIGQKGSALDEIQGQYMGLMKFSKKGLSWISDLTNRLPEDVLNKLDMTALLQRLIKAGHSIYGMPIQGNWCEIDSENDLLIARELFKK